MTNRITEVRLTLVGSDWYVYVTKEFAAEHGGGSQIFSEYAGRQIHRAVDVAREMVTVSPGERSPGDPHWIRCTDVRVALDAAHRALKPIEENVADSNIVDPVREALAQIARAMEVTHV